MLDIAFSLFYNVCRCIKEVYMITYNTNTFSSLIDETSFCLGEVNRLSFMTGAIFPLIPHHDKSLLLKYITCKLIADASAFDVELCSSIIKVFLDDKNLLENPSNLRESLLTIVKELDILSDESIVVKAALLHHSIVSSTIITNNKYQIADILSVFYLYKSHRLPLPYFYIDSSFINNEKLILGDVNNYILLFLSLLCESAKKHLVHLEKVIELKSEILSIVSKFINRPQSGKIIDFIFSTPIFTAEEMSKALELTRGQVIRHLHVLEGCGIIKGDDKQRKRTFYFKRLLNMCFE